MMESSDLTLRLDLLYDSVRRRNFLVAVTFSYFVAASRGTVHPVLVSGDEANSYRLVRLDRSGRARHLLRRIHSDHECRGRRDRDDCVDAVPRDQLHGIR